MTPQPKLTWKGRLTAFGVSAFLCVALLEGVSRFFDRTDKALTQTQLNLQPYMMFGGHPQKNPIWRNIQTKTDIPSTMSYNNFGLTIDIDVSIPPTPEFLRKYSKAAGEKLVVVTGASVMNGLGATANEKTIAGQLEVALNRGQSKHKYRVLNLAVGSWISYQQFIGLSLFGLPLKPDWIVVMDGHNDAGVSCPAGSGVWNPVGWPQLIYLAGGGEGLTRKGPLVQWLVRNSAAARLVTGLQPTGPNAQLDSIYIEDAELEGRFRIKMRDLKFSILDKQVEFYLLAQQNVKELFSSASVIFSSQPLLHDNAVSPSYRKAFDLAPENEAPGREALRADLDAYMAKTSNAQCNVTLAPQALGYFMGRSALRMEEAAAEWSSEAKARSILYANPEMLFPSELKLRELHFVDNAHMSDLGQHQLGEYFAGYILKTDLNMPFDPRELSAAVRAEATRIADQPRRTSP